MRSVPSFTLVSLAVVGCWFDLGDVDSSSTQTSSSSSSGGSNTTSTATTSGQGGDGGSAGSPIGGAGQGGLGGDGGQGGVPGGGFGGEGGGGPLGDEEDFINCQLKGYPGTCAQEAELLFYFDVPYDGGECNDQDATNKCIINRCVNEASMCGYYAECLENRCLEPDQPLRGDDTADCAALAMDANGRCYEDVAIRRLSATNCDFKDCKALNGVCKVVQGVADCYLP